MSTKIKELSLDTRPGKYVVVDSLTRDISVEACIFDLIDNSIDAARDNIYKTTKNTPKDTVPDSYEGYDIKININGDTFSIADNCGGIDTVSLEKTALRFGDRSSHNMGIGVFGVGLNRALFKIGRHTEFVTDTGKQRTSFTLDTDAYLENESWNIPATTQPTKRIIETNITVSKLPIENSQLFSDQDWLDGLIEQIGKRYCKIIHKGLQIKINNTIVDSLPIEIRQNSPYDTVQKFFKVGEIAIYLESGQHKHHKFTSEPEYNSETNSGLTGEYGWTIFCNERAIVLSDKTRKTGWIKKFHSEHYGFVGTISFTCKNPELLPWNTTKTDVDLNNKAYQTALNDMEKFVDKWRKYTGAVKRHKSPLIAPPESPPASGPDKPKPKPPKKPTSPASAPNIKPVTKIDHNSFTTILPEDINQAHCYDKHLALVNEAKLLNLNTHPYAGLALIRMLFEASSICFLVRKNLFETLKNEIIISRNNDRASRSLPELSTKELKNLEPTLDEIINFLVEHESIWDSARRNKIKHSLNKFSSHKPTLNGVVHNTFQQTNRLTAFAIRDEIIPALRYLIET